MAFVFLSASMSLFEKAAQPLDIKCLPISRFLIVKNCVILLSKFTLLVLISAKTAYF
jgi:hypothetical protein